MFLTDQPTVLSVNVYNSSGTLTDLDADPTYTVVDAAGGTAATGTATANGTGVYEATFTASDPDLFAVTWEGDLSGSSWSQTTWHEAVGSVLFTESDFRAFNDDQFSSTARYSDAAIAAARAAVTEQLERWTGRSWVTRHCRLVTAGNGDWQLPFAGGYARTSTGRQMYRPGRLQDIDRVLSAEIGSTSLTTSSLTIVGGHLHRGTTWTLPTVNDPLNVTVEYVYGMPYVVDGVDRIAMLLAADRLRETALSERATTWSDELGTYRFETPGRAGNVSSIPEVNEWVKAHRSPLLSL